MRGDQIIRVAVININVKGGGGKIGGFSNIHKYQGGVDCGLWMFWRIVTEAVYGGVAVEW